MKTSEPKPTKEEIFNKHLDYLEVCSHIDDSRYTTLEGLYEVRTGTRIMYDMMYGRILRAMQEYAESYHKEKLRDALMDFCFEYKAYHHSMVVLIDATDYEKFIDEYLETKE